MTILNCSAVTCIYNKDQLCSRGEIEVMGHDARVSDCLLYTSLYKEWLFRKYPERLS